MKYDEATDTMQWSMPPELIAFGMKSVDAITPNGTLIGMAFIELDTETAAPGRQVGSDTTVRHTIQIAATKRIALALAAELAALAETL